MNDFREYSNYLMHYGIPGQKHGIRRYQNEDGSLTQEGKRRYLVNATRQSNVFGGNDKGFNVSDKVYVNNSGGFISGRTNYRHGTPEWAKNDAAYERGDIVHLSKKGQDLYKHDVTINKVAKFLDSIDNKLFNKTTSEVIEDKIIRAEEKAQSILKKLKNLF